MQKRFLLLTLLGIQCCFASAQIGPEVYSWIINTTNATGYNGIPSNIQQVQYSDNNVYVSATCIPGYDIGPWAGNPNTPANQNFVFKITRHPAKNTGTPIQTGLGHIGVFSNGVSIFNPKDAMSYKNQNVWYQNAIIVEGPSFDDCLGHPAGNGEYHHHLNPTCLYDDSLTTEHSPIIGYAFDGFPVYGAFAYANANGTGGIKRMQSSYAKRNITKRNTLPDGSTASSTGPDVSTTYPLGYYVQDFEYIDGSGDLDEHNGRYCVTPEYPDGMYCYFVTLDSDLVAEYPYLIGPTYYGTVQTGNTGPGSGHNSINETVITYTGTSSVTEPTGRLKWGLFPNPTRNMLNIYVERNMPNNITFELVNSVGQVVLSRTNLQPTVQYSFDLSEFGQGIYFARMIAGQEVATRKFVLE
ncbi:MAG: YHYH protein [Flavobacteriales bacterium]|nr:YHYH protein [Flavobacteriales bacterium]MCB9448283.1 YHYH protein [Flavobacteriales bacterium]